MDVYVQAAVDPADVLAEMSDGELREHGAVRIASAGWNELANALRRSDYRETERLLNEMAIEQHGRSLPDFTFADAVYVAATPTTF